MSYQGSFRDLIHRVDQFVGIPFDELGELVGMPYEGSALRNRGWAGNVVHALLGDDTSNAPEPDLEAHGVEVKSLPIDRHGKVLEPTKIDSLNYDKVAATDWWHSQTFHKLRSILFVPVVKYDPARPPDFFIRFPFLWFPTPADLSQFQRDYEEVRALIRSGEFTKLSSAEPPNGQGVALHTKPNHGKGSKPTSATYQGKSIPVEKRGWMLRMSFTRPIMLRNFSDAHRRARDELEELRRLSGRESGAAPPGAPG